MLRARPALLLLALAGCAHNVAVRPAEPLGEGLARALDQGRRAIGAPGASQVVLQGTDRWAAASGWAARRARPATPDDVYRIGSITKTYTAAALVALHVEGVLSLDDPAARWVPDAPHGERYTLRQALAHQTGLRDFVHTPRFALRLGRDASMRELLAHVDRRALVFAPGTRARYSNTNYLVVGLAIEAATGRRWGEVVRERLLTPLGLERTWIPSLEPEPTELARGYLAGFDVTDRFVASRASAGGEIAATAEDVARTMQALFVGDLVDPRVVALMTEEQRTVDGAPTGFGLGVRLRDTAHGRLIGHSGSTVSFQSRFHVHPASGTVVVSLTNSFLSEADELDDRAWRVLAGAAALGASARPLAAVSDAVSR